MYKRQDKNHLCGVVPLPDDLEGFVKMTAANMMNQFNWGQNKDLRQWLANNRLDGFSGLTSNVDPDDTAKMAIMLKIRDNVMPAMMKLQSYMAQF